MTLPAVAPRLMPLALAVALFAVACQSETGSDTPDPVAAAPAAGPWWSGLLVPRLPAIGGGQAVLALLGGIGGSVTVVCYAYWMRAEGWRGAEKPSLK